MSHASRKANRKELKAQRTERKRVQKALGQDGLPQISHTTISNGKSNYQNTAEEGVARTEATW